MYTFFGTLCIYVCVYVYIYTYTHTHIYIYIYITRLASNEIFPPSNKIHREVGRAKDLSASLYFLYTKTTALTNNTFPIRQNLFRFQTLRWSVAIIWIFCTACVHSRQKSAVVAFTFSWRNTESVWVTYDVTTIPSGCRGICANWKKKKDWFRNKTEDFWDATMCRGLFFSDCLTLKMKALRNIETSWNNLPNDTV